MAVIFLRVYGPVSFAIGGVAIFAGLIGMLTLHQMDTEQQTRLLVAHSQGVLGDISKMGVLVRDAERGQRGYVLTGDAAYLQPYEAAREGLLPLSEQLRQLVANNPHQQQQLVSLLALMQEKFAELEETVQLRRNAGEESAKRVVMDDRGRHLMEQITPLLHAMAAEEQLVLEQRNESIEWTDRGMRRITAGGSVLAVLMMALAVLMLRRSSAQRRAMEAEREVQRQDQERCNADLQEFAYAASHDLKAPLRAIGHLADWIREDVDPAAKPAMIENLGLLQGRAARMQLLLDGLLAYSRVGRKQLAVEDVDVAGMVREIAAMLEHSSGFVVVCEGSMPPIRTHPAPLRLVLHHLISNALRHHDLAEGRVTVSMRLRDGEAEFRVGDDGPGIPKHLQSRIFVIFHTLISRDQKESTGIGLAIVKKKIEGNGGQIRVESDPPVRGSTFVFSWKISAP